MSAEEVAPPQPRLPARFWTLIDFGIITLEEAQAEWVKQQAAGAQFDDIK